MSFGLFSECQPIVDSKALSSAVDKYPESCSGTISLRKDCIIKIFGTTGVTQTVKVSNKPDQLRQVEIHQLFSSIESELILLRAPLPKSK